MATNTEKLDNIATSITRLTTLFEESDKKVAMMHKILVVGNSHKPLVESVRNHEEWICEQKAEKQKVDTRKWEIKKTYIGLSVGWVLTLIGLGVALFG